MLPKGKIAPVLQPDGSGMSPAHQGLLQEEPGRAGREGAAVALPCLGGCPERSLKHLRIHCSVTPWIPGSFGKVLMQNIMGWLQ